MNIQLENGHIPYNAIEHLGIKKTTIENYFHDFRGVSIHEPGWKRERIIPGNIFSEIGFGDYRIGDIFTVSVTSRSDDRLAGGWQSYSQTFQFRIVAVSPHAHAVEIEYIGRCKDHIGRHYPDYGKIKTKKKEEKNVENTF